jgi:hypothetical protein
MKSKPKEIVLKIIETDDRLVQEIWFSPAKNIQFLMGNRFFLTNVTRVTLVNSLPIKKLERYVS